MAQRMSKTILILVLSGCSNPLSSKFRRPCRHCRTIAFSASAAVWFVLKRPPETELRSTSVIGVPSAATGSTKAEPRPLAFSTAEISPAKASSCSPMSIPNRANTSFIRSFSSPMILSTSSNTSPAGPPDIRPIGDFSFGPSQSSLPPFEDNCPHLAEGYSLLRGNRV